MAVVLDDAGRIALPDGVRLGLDGLAKGMIVDQALDAGRHAAPTALGMMIDIGGDIRCWGCAPGRHGWPVAIGDPFDPSDSGNLLSILELRDKAIATSGRGNRDLVAGDGHRSFIIDPRTGALIRHIAGVTVVADRAVDADALATAFMVMSPEESVALADTLPGVATQVVAANGTRSTSGMWDQLKDMFGRTRARVTGTPAAPAEQRIGAAWPSGFKHDVSYEVPALKIARYRRPYLAIWITDEDDRVVRTLLLLGRRAVYASSNYIPD